MPAVSPEDHDGGGLSEIASLKPHDRGFPSKAHPASREGRWIGSVGPTVVAQKPVIIGGVRIDAFTPFVAALSLV